MRPQATRNKSNSISAGGNGGHASMAMVGSRSGTPVSRNGASRDHSLSTLAEDANGAEGLQMRTWTELDMGGMGLRALSPELFRYSFLTRLYINNNKLKVLPHNIHFLQNLVELDASANLLTQIPPELGLCCRLRELLLFDNRIDHVPYELGTLYMLETLGLEGNPVEKGVMDILQRDGTRVVIEYLRDSRPIPPPPPDRQWITFDASVQQDSKDVLTALSYNLLSPKYATPAHYSYCPSWAVDWQYRRDLILSELAILSSDILCLQELVLGDYESFFRPKLAESGYAGMFWQKSRARTMNEEERKNVDGCAIFYRTSLFELVGTHLLEFQRAAMTRKSVQRSEDLFNRFLTKDNICGFVVLRHKTLEGGPLLIVANTHLHWDPEFVDVKMLQCAMLMDELALLAHHFRSSDPNCHGNGSNGGVTSPRPAENGPSSRSNTPATVPVVPQYQLAKCASASVSQLAASAAQVSAIVCGDFNSLPNSGLYQFMTRGKLPADNPDLKQLASYTNCGESGLSHCFNIRSSYATIHELPVTNFKPYFEGTLDYIWSTSKTLVPTGVLGPVDEQWRKTVVGFPHPHIPSDHIPVMSEFRWRCNAVSSKPEGESTGAGSNISK
ncbi:Glucose-repressible alcohol dehydrogenase transcriptional effector [Spiromyces aspiralis]|uniref:Glucose-repressible alcohol dehydrogenase transcriptional effector n=1 Tax=Spiromyces aspiralis TaxID=68401 RepID=A0ACC1HG43_9FUNG|nr:Glucose-repressible alcohol dehydrogenase transcriptional effector [Spiromyces aspiralis]